MLLADPGLAARLRAHPEAIPDAVEEFLRLESPLPAASLRRATEPLELVGQAIAEGDCLGASLARLESEIAFRQLLDRFPKLARVDPAAPLKWRSNLINRGLTELSVTLR